MTEQNIPEILAPAGTYEAMEAAVKAGCDAVYAGGSLFSARAYAGNFDEAAFLKAIDFCHLFGVKVYMTVNTLLKDAETAQLASYLAPYYEAGLDAVLVQDMGVYQVLHQAFPKLPLHVSTQMSISSAYGAQMAKDLGFTRVVPARELSLEEIRKIKEKVDIEIETFVHGAMCFAYSGKCLFSSFAGGRSGNRGRCAQPCRKCYELFDTGTEEQGPSVTEYLMSLKDICTLEELPCLIDAGIDSFKIEGRMKNPFYVASVVQAYRSARDLYLTMKTEEGAADFESLSTDAKNKYLAAAAEAKKELQDIYNRGGFYSGYYFTDKGLPMIARKRPNHQGVRIGTVQAVKPPKIAVQLIEDMHRGDVYELREAGSEERLKPKQAEPELTSGADGKAGEVVYLNGNQFQKIRPKMEVWRTRNAALLEQMETEILQVEPQITARCFIEAVKGQPLSISLTAEAAGKDGSDVFVQVMGDPVEAAAKAATTEEALTEKAKKSGTEHIRVEEVICRMEPDVFIPMSRFNALRRQAAEELKEKIIAAYHRPCEK